jgi:hypothetical protein
MTYQIAKQNVGYQGLKARLPKVFFLPQSLQNFPNPPL